MIDPNKATAWVQQDNKNPPIESLLYLWYRWAPKFFNTNIYIPDLLFGSIRLFSVFALTALPFGIDYLYHTSLTKPQLWLVTGIIAILIIYQWLYDRLTEYYRTEQKHRDSESKLASRQFQALQQLLGHVSLSSRPASTMEREGIIKNILVCIEHKTRIILKEYGSDYYQVSLLLFNDSACNTIRVANRASLYRATGTIINSSETIAYYVAKANKSKVLNDLKRMHIFPFKGLSDSPPPYRSILFIPVTVPDSTNPTGKICKGLVTLDSSRPYEFWGQNSDDILTQSMPYIGLLELLLKNHPHGLSI